MGKLPAPPARLPAIRRGDIKIIKAGTELWGIYFAGGPFPGLWNQFRFFGPRATARFDHHIAPAHLQSRGIMYTAFDGSTCFAEVFQSTRRINRNRRQPWLASFILKGHIEVLDLRGSWPTRAGASQAINSGSRNRAREWSARIYDDYPAVQGLIYPSSMYGGQNVLALFERAVAGIPSHPAFNAPLSHPGLRLPIANAAITIGYGVA